ncbi:transposable element Tcb1 transposase [Trichonephila clavipes]|nr:transposable element Tcb1 transposase [Trichonephila clavipes]
MKRIKNCRGKEKVVREICKRLEMQRDCALRISDRRRLTSFFVENKTIGVRSSGSERCHLHEDETQDALDRPQHLKKCTRTTNCFISRNPAALDAHPSTPRLEWCRARENWTAAEWNQVVFSDESRFNLSSDDNHVRVWRPRGERLNPAFALQHHTTPTAVVMVWGDMTNNTRSPLVLIRGTMTPQRYVHDILQPHALPLMQQRALLQQDNTRPHTARVSQDCLIPIFVSNRVYLGSFGTAS